MMILTLVLSLFGCGEKKTADGGSGDADNVNAVTDNYSDGSEEKEEITEGEWGKSGYFTTATKDGEIQGLYINYPHLTGISEASGKIAYQNDDTLVILDGQYELSPDVKDGKIENVLESYFSQTVDILKGYRTSDFKNFKLNIKKQKKVKVGDYEMCKFTGTISSETDDKKYDDFFTAYSTKLKGNDTFVYWLVLDDSEDQSLNKTAEEYADKMSETLVEK